MSARTLPIPPHAAPVFPARRDVAGIPVVAVWREGTRTNWWKYQALVVVKHLYLAQSPWQGPDPAVAPLVWHVCFARVLKQPRKDGVTFGAERGVPADDFLILYPAAVPNNGRFAPAVNHWLAATLANIEEGPRP